MSEEIVETKTTETKKTWIENTIRVVCAIVGVVLSYFGMDMYYTTKIETAHEQAKKTYVLIVAAMDQLKAGKYGDAFDTIGEAREAIVELKGEVTEIVAETKDAVTNIKNEYVGIKNAVANKDKVAVKGYAANIVSTILKNADYEKLSPRMKKIYDIASLIVSKKTDEEITDEEVVTLIDAVEELNTEITAE